MTNDEPRQMVEQKHEMHLKNWSKEEACIPLDFHGMTIANQSLSSQQKSRFVC